MAQVNSAYDLLSPPYLLFRSNPEIPERFQNRFQYILIIDDFRLRKMNG